MTSEQTTFKKAPQSAGQIHPPTSGRFASFRQDALASVVVFLVALPLCMGIALASGVPVAAGLIAGIVGGLVVGPLAGCPLQVSGPAAGLTVIVYDVVQRFGLETLGVIVLIAGVIQVVAGVLKLGQWFRAVSPAVIKGMLSGIGVLILASQFHVMVDDKPKGSGIQNLATIPAAIGKGLALPELNPREVRQFRTEMLHSVGELHRRQVSLFERIAERIPSHGQLAMATESPEHDTVPSPVDLSDLAVEQEAISAELTSVANRLNEYRTQSGDTPRAMRIAEAATEAIGSNEAAVAAMRHGEATTIPPTQIEAIASLDELLAQHKNHHLAAILGTLTIAVILLWQAFVPKGLKAVPAPLVAVVLATLVAAAVAVPVLYVEVPDNLWSDVHFPTLTAVNAVSWSALFQAGLLIAVVASAETLLCATAVDQLHGGTPTKYDRELFAQGVGNMTCGILGALPLTGVIVRSSANVQAGGRTRLSAFLHGVWLLVFVAGLAFVLRSIPTASLAAILVYTGYKLINFKAIRDLRAYGWGEVGIYAATVATIVVADLLTGVLTGIALAAAKLLYTFSHLSADLVVTPERDKATLTLHGAATFVRLPRLASALEQIPARAELHVDFQYLDYIDHACLDLLMNWAKQHESSGGKLVIDWESLHARFRAENSNGNGKSWPTVRPRVSSST